jgi:uncharacterized membrane protein
MPWRLQSEPTTAERICGGLSYLTFGIAGLLYMILSKSGSQSQLFRFHFFQSVLMSILGMLIGWAAEPLLQIVMSIMGAVAPSVVSGFASSVGFIAIILTNTFRLALLYGAVWAFLGKFAEVPFISDIVRQNMRA